jgi:RNA polymerase subunit RPABC4/transcription elongation factor Spt4
MNDQAFLNALTKKYPQLIKDPELEDINDFIKALTDEGRSKLWEEFRDTYTNVSRPNRAHFVTTATRISVSRKGVEKSYEYFCYTCQIFYPTDARCCPKCRNTENGGYILVYAQKRPSDDTIARALKQFQPGPHPTMAVKVKGAIPAATLSRWGDIKP